MAVPVKLVTGAGMLVQAVLKRSTYPFSRGQVGASRLLTVSVAVGHPQVVVRHRGQDPRIGILGEIVGGGEPQVIQAGNPAGAQIKLFIGRDLDPAGHVGVGLAGHVGHDHGGGLEEGFIGGELAGDQLLVSGAMMPCGRPGVAGVPRKNGPPWKKK